MSDIGLKACPFCKEGYPPELTEYKDVLCDSCGTKVDIETWQKRPIEDTLRERIKDLICMFEDLTPGGSEFHNDPKRCHDFIRDRLASFGKVALERNEQRARIIVLRAALAAEREKTRWVPVSELPEKETTEQWEMYLCRLNRYGEILVAPLCFIGGSWVTSGGSYGSCYDEYVTHYMLLPEPPKEGEE